MTRQALADARSLAQAASADTSHPPNGAISALAAAVQALCDAVESLERDEGPRLPLDPKVWEMRAAEFPVECAFLCPAGDGWIAVQVDVAQRQWDELGPHGSDRVTHHGRMVVVTWARKREGAK